MEGILDWPFLSIDELLANHVRVAGEITRDLRILEPFAHYLKHGYYPFYKDAVDGLVREANYYVKLRQVVGQVLEVDYPKIEEVTVRLFGFLY